MSDYLTHLYTGWIAADGQPFWGSLNFCGMENNAQPVMWYRSNY